VDLLPVPIVSELARIADIIPPEWRVKNREFASKIWKDAEKLYARMYPESNYARLAGSRFHVFPLACLALVWLIALLSRNQDNLNSYRVIIPFNEGTLWYDGIHTLSAQFETRWLLSGFRASGKEFPDAFSRRFSKSPFVLDFETGKTISPTELRLRQYNQSVYEDASLFSRFFPFGAVVYFVHLNNGTVSTLLPNGPLNPVQFSIMLPSELRFDLMLDIECLSGVRSPKAVLVRIDGTESFFEQLIRTRGDDEWTGGDPYRYPLFGGEFQQYSTWWPKANDVPALRRNVLYLGRKNPSHHLGKLLSVSLTMVMDAERMVFGPAAQEEMLYSAKIHGVSVIQGISRNGVISTVYYSGASVRSSVLTAQQSVKVVLQTRFNFSAN
jgi:hypothetical protein